MHLHRFVFGALFLASAGLLPAACGSSDDNGTGSTGSGGFLCELGGQSCPGACFPGVGCSECGSDGDCPASKPVCVVGQCAICGADGDCGAGQACFPRDHTCHPKCATNNDCNGDAPTCDTTSGECVGCTTDTSCQAPRPICDSSSKQCAACGADSDCGLAAPVCDLQQGQCVGCLVDSDCPAGDRCGGNHDCHPFCTSDASCGESDHPFCDTTSGDCVACITNMDCGTGAEDLCSMGRCVACLANSDCAAPTPLCDPGPGDCVECIMPQDCPMTLPKCHQGSCVAK